MSNVFLIFCLNLFPFTSKDRNCNEYPFQVLLVEGRALDSLTNDVLALGDFIRIDQKLFLQKNAYLVLVDCSGNYYEFDREILINISSLKFEKAPKRTPPDFARMNFVERVWDASVITDYNSPIFFTSPNPYQDIVHVNRTAVCVRWVDVSTRKDKRSYAVEIRTVRGRVIQAVEVDTTQFEIAEKLMGGEPAFVIEVSPVGESRNFTTKAFFFDPKFRKQATCDETSAVEDLIIAFYLESKGFLTEAKLFYKTAVEKDGLVHKSYSDIYEKFLKRNAF